MSKKGKKHSKKNNNNNNNNNNTYNNNIVNNSNINYTTSEYSYSTRIDLFRVVITQNEECICGVLAIAGLPRIVDITKDLGLKILKLADYKLKEIENYLESKNIYFREECLIDSGESTNTTSTSSNTDTTTTTTTITYSSTSKEIVETNLPSLLVVNNKSNIIKSKQKRPIPKQESFNKIIEYNFDLIKIFKEYIDDETITNKSQVFITYDLFILDSFILLSDKLENTQSTLDDFKNYYKNNENLNKFIKEFENNLIENYLELVEVVAGWYIPQKDYAIVKFLNCFGVYLDSTTIESFCYIYNKVIKKEDEWAIQFIQASLSSDIEFKKQVMWLNDEVIQERYDESLYSIMHALKYDNVREFILLYTHDENYFRPEEFWYLICKYDAVAITQHILNNNIEEEDMIKKSGKESNIFNENPLEINPLSLLEYCSANFSHKIASALFQLYDFKDSMIIKPRLKGVLKPTTAVPSTTTTTTTTSTNTNVQSNISSSSSTTGSGSGNFQYFRILNANCYFNEITKKRASIFIDLMTEWNIYMNTEVGEGLDDNVESDSIYTFQNSPEYLAINCNNIHNLKRSNISLLSKVLEFNDKDILYSLLKNLTQGGCTLCRELIDEKQLLITISRPQYFTCLQILNQNGYTIVPKYQQRDPYIFFAGSRHILEFLLDLHENIYETIDIRHWIQAIMSAGQYSSEREFFEFYPKIHELSQKDKYSRTLNILELQYILAHIEGIEFLLQKYLGFVKPYHVDNQQLLEIFDVTFVQKKDLRSQESIQAEIDLLEQEEIEKKKLKEKRKKDEKEKKKQQLLNKQQKQQNQQLLELSSTLTISDSSSSSSSTSTTPNTPTKKQTTSNTTTTPTKPTSKPIAKSTSKPTQTTVNTTTTTTPTTSKETLPTTTTTTTNLDNKTAPATTTTTTTTIKSSTLILPIKELDISIGKFKFSRKDEYIIGRGSNGTLVFKGLWNDRIPVAIKQMHKAFNPLISKEIDVLINLTNKNCNNIVRYIDQEEDDMFVYLGLTLCNGSLQELVEKSNINNGIGGDINLESTTTTTTTIIETTSKLKQFIGTESRLLELIKDILNGIDFLHQQGIVHNDLNPRNILIKDDRFIISDLGLSKMEVTTSYSFTMHAPTGQEGFHPAEVLLEKRKTKSVDIFSLGCILFYLMTDGQHPFGDKFFRMVNILTGKQDLSALKHNIVACDLINQMISKNESDRPTTTSIFQHPLFWNHEKKIKFIDCSLNLFKDPNGLFTTKLNKLINQYQDILDDVNSNGNNIVVPFLSKPWNQLIDPILIEHISNKQNQLSSTPSSPLSSSTGGTNKVKFFYDYSQVKDLVRCIRNTVQHSKEIQRFILQSSSAATVKKEVLECLDSPESVLSYFESKIPDLLFFLYQKFKIHLDSKTLSIYFSDHYYNK